MAAGREAERAKIGGLNGNQRVPTGQCLLVAALAPTLQRLSAGGRFPVIKTAAPRRR
jgi:hypothetical protein